MTNNKKIIKVGTFFSGIGSPKKALYKLKQDGLIFDYKLEFFSEIDKDAIKSYCAIHNVDESLNIGSIIEVKKYSYVVSAIVIFIIALLYLIISPKIEF